MEPIVRAFAQRRARGDEELTEFNAACEVAKMLGRRGDLMEGTVRVLLAWARENRSEWFVAIEPKSTTTTEPTTVPQPARPRPDHLSRYRRTGARGSDNVAAGRAQLIPLMSPCNSPHRRYECCNSANRAP